MTAEQYLPACVVPTVKFGGGGIRVWGCFSWNGLCPLRTLNGNENAEGYKDILSCCILSRVEDQFSDDNCLYQLDSAPCHKARSVREWFMDNKVPEMNWPAQSPDLNPTEHPWDELECRLLSRPQCPTSLTALATALQEEWAAIPPKMFNTPTICPTTKTILIPQSINNYHQCTHTVGCLYHHCFNHMP
jgi:hypothetical protein